MIFIKDLTWSNWFSYGENNYINFEEPVLQIIGFNGAGKTSIPLILQEVFYSKNTKGKKKAALPNRYLDKPLLSAICNFEDEKGNQYTIILKRRTILKLQLLKNGQDISSHTTTNTYKTIQKIVGLDFKTFAQLVYQSSTDNLEFLTATDSNRKKFLIVLFNLQKYLSIHEQFKLVSSNLNIELVSINSKLSTIQAWIDKHSKMDFNEKDIKEIPILDEEVVNRLGELQVDLKNITATNKKINQNNQYKELLANLDTKSLYVNLILDQKEKDNILKQVASKKKRVTENVFHIKNANTLIAKIGKLGAVCPTCRQDIKTETINKMHVAAEDTKLLYTDNNTTLNYELSKLTESLTEIAQIEAKIKKKAEVSSDLVKLQNSIDKQIQSKVLNPVEIKQEIQDISGKLKQINEQIATVSKENTLASAYNSKIEVIQEQLENHKLDIEINKIDADDLQNTIAKLDILKKAFSPSGLLSYKIDFLVKDLETEINTYLGVLSGGQFQFIFKLDKEKLNIKIIDEGIAVSIEELSAGELARINAATLLAIRKLMAAISSTKINILFLDEIMGVLDEEGKEKLIEVLHSEKGLNTMLVSHEYSHPLIPKITIIKEKKISRIEK